MATKMTGIKLGFKLRFLWSELWWEITMEIANWWSSSGLSGSSNPDWERPSHFHEKNRILERKNKRKLKMMFLRKNYALSLRSRDWGQPTSFLHRRASQNVRWIQQNAELFGTKGCPFIWVVNGLIDVALDDDCRNISTFQTMLRVRMGAARRY